MDFNSILDLDLLSWEPLDYIDNVDSPGSEPTFMSMAVEPVTPGSSTDVTWSLSPHEPALSPSLMLPGLQEAPTPETTPPQQLRTEDRAPGVPARAWRYRERPETCPICDKGHPYKTDLERHIAANHPDQAAKYNVSTARPVCPWCNDKSYARKDHLVRHLRAKHSLQKGQRRRKRANGSGLR